MYEHIRGTLVTASYPHVVLETGGVGYRFRVPLSTHSRLPASGEVRLLCHLHVREDELTFFGFLTEEERSLFEKLLQVGGVGPGTALQVLSTFSPQELQESILKEDFARIGRVKGIGPKLARRIVLELKGLVRELYGGDGEVFGKSLGPAEGEALAALQKLGYPRRAAARALEETLLSRGDDKGPAPSEELVLDALRRL
jgi:Holliday junction DNA helicase RuvA